MRKSIFAFNVSVSTVYCSFTCWRASAGKLMRSLSTPSATLYLRSTRVNCDCSPILSEFFKATTICKTQRRTVHRYLIDPEICLPGIRMRSIEGIDFFDCCSSHVLLVRVSWVSSLIHGRVKMAFYLTPMSTHRSSLGREHWGPHSHSLEKI